MFKQSLVTPLQNYHEPPEQGYSHLRTLYIVNDMLKQAEADGLDINYILPRILQLATMELGAFMGSIIVVDPDENVEYGWSVDGKNSYQIHYIPFLADVVRKGIAGLAMRSQMTVRIDNTLTDDRWLAREDHVTSKEAWSAVCTPLIARQRSIGALTITKPGVRQLALEDIHLLGAIAAQAAVTIDNARLYAATQRQLCEAELFNAASKAINSSLETNQIMHSMLAQMNELLNADAISIALVEGNELVYTVASGVGSEEIVGLRLPTNQGISGWVMEYAQPTLVNTPDQDPRFHHSADIRTGHRTHAMICVPLEAEGRVLGTLQAINPRNGHFSQDDLRILMRLASLASGAIAKAEQYALTQAAEARYLSLFEDNIDPIIIADARGIIREANHRVGSMLGYNRHQMIGESINILHQEDISYHIPHILQNPNNKIEIITTQAMTKQKKIIPVELHIKRTLGNELQCIYHDISKQVELEQMRNDLTAMLLHDLQNPLSNVISSLELLEMELPEDEGDESIARVMVNVAYRSSHRLRHLIRSLLDINQLEAGAPVHEVTSASVAEIIHEVADVMSASFERRELVFRQQIAPNLKDVYVNQDMIERVLINLVDNAIKFSKRGDVLTVSAELYSDTHICLSVSDQGPGIPAQYRQSIFDKFYRTPNNTSKGIGLGLAFCRLAVEAHTGRIWADEAEGGGARFNLTLPTRPIPTGKPNKAN